MYGKRSFIRFIFVFCLVYASLCFAQREPLGVIDALRQSQKIIEPEVVLEDFVRGEVTTRVIVNLWQALGSKETIDFKDSASRVRLQERVKAAQDRVSSLLDAAKVRITNKFVYVPGFSAEVTAEGLQELTALAEVFSINKDRVLAPHLKQGISLINGSTVRNTYNGSGISIAICDTGIDYNHPKLGGGGFPNAKVIGGYDTGQNDNDPMDAHGHGTSCAGIAAGDLGTEGDYIGGVAYNAKLYALKITYSTTGGSAYESDMIEAWEWCVTHQSDDPNNPIMVISTSFGGGYYSSICDNVSPAMTQAAANAVAAGITLFVSSGNDGFCDGTGWPACISQVNAVGAVYDADIGSKNGWCIDSASCIGYFAFGCPSYWACDDPSTSGDLVICYSNTADFVSIFAPSNNAYTTDISGSGGYSSGDYFDRFGGTSAACPYAAGAAACLQSAAKSIASTFLTPTAVKSLLTSTGDLITDTKINIAKPRVNLGGAIAKVENPDLVVLNIETNPVDPEPGEAVNVSVTIKNEGMVDAEPFWVDWYSDLDAEPLPGEHGDRREEVTSLAAGGIHTMTSTYVYPSSGVYRMAAQVDTDQVVDESHEDNNVLWPVTALVGICECDLNDDGQCDMQDWLLFGQDWGRVDCNDPGAENCECDLNQDGICDMQDWLVFGEDWGRTDCPLPPPVFFEDFEDGVADNWVDDGSGAWSVAAGVYNMIGISTGDVRYSYYDEVFDDFTYEVDVRRTQGSLLHAQGMIFRWGDTGENGYVFHMGGNGRYLILKVINGSYTFLIPEWTDSDAIKTGYDVWNTLKVVGSGTTMEFYINNTLVESLLDSEFSSGRVGVKALDGGGTPYNIMHFDNARLTLDVDLSGAQPKPALSIPVTVEASEISQ